MLRLCIAFSTVTVLNSFMSSTMSKVQMARVTAVDFSSNSDVFGGSSTKVDDPKVAKGLSSDEYKITGNFQDEAARLRQEAAEMEVALREEARAKGLPEDVINKLVPLRAEKSATKSQTKSEEPLKSSSLTPTEIRSKLGYLNSGDAIRFVSELDRLKTKSIVGAWNSKDLSKATFQVNNAQLMSKTKIEAAKLKMDSAGFDYVRVFGTAIITATILALSSSFVGGQLGFLLGYSSALLPILLVGIGSIAPALIGDIVNQITYSTDAKAKDRYIEGQAGKFLVGYLVGLPIARFTTGGASNTAEFFQLRPSGKSEVEDKRMFASRKFSQQDVARCTAVCMAAPVAECIAYGEASGTSTGDVNLLYELLNAVDPPLSTDASQSHVRWAIVTAHEILTSNKDQLKRLKVAFAEGRSLEECIAYLEGVEDGLVVAAETTE